MREGTVGGWRIAVGSRPVDFNGYSIALLIAPPEVV
jgi:hypothetical protein